VHRGAGLFASIGAKKARAQGVRLAGCVENTGIVEVPMGDDTSAKLSSASRAE
jgi:NADH:ubiquinone oxidoreductase subunit F (NADH-binding)